MDILKMYKELTPDMMRVNDDIISAGTCDNIKCRICPHSIRNITVDGPPTLCISRAHFLGYNSIKHPNVGLFLAKMLKEAYEASQHTIEDISDD